MNGQQPPPGGPPGSGYPPGPPQNPYAAPQVPSGYPPGPPPGQYAPMMKPHRGGSILALGIIGLVCCGICGIIAWVMGNSDLAEMDAGIMDPSGRGLTKAGRIMGIISVVLSIIGIIATVLINLLMPKPDYYGSRSHDWDLLGRARSAVERSVGARARPWTLPRVRRSLLRRSLGQPQLRKSRASEGSQGASNPVTNRVNLLGIT